MKKIQVFMTGIAALAASVSLADGQSNSLTEFDKLVLSDSAAVSFSAQAGETAQNCSVAITSGKGEVSGGYYVLEGELADGPVLTVTPTDSTTNIIEKFDVSFKAAFVSADDLPQSITDAKIGFALTSATTAKYFDGTGWSSDLTVSSSVEEDSVCALHIDYDNREKKARFILTNVVDSVKTEVYKSAFVSVAAVSNNTLAVMGCGSVGSLAGSTWTIAAEVIVVTPPGGTEGKDIQFSTAQMDALREQVGGDASAVAEKLNSTTPQGNGLKPMDNFVLYGTVNDEKITEDTVPVVKGVKASTEGNIAVNVPAFNPQSVSGVTVTYKLMGATSKDGSYSTEIATSTTSANLEFTPASAQGCKYFKVVTTIEY